MKAFQPLLGQNQAVELLTQAIRRDRLAPAYLFVGPVGVGKTLAARCCIEALFSAEAAKVNSDLARSRLAALQRRLRGRNHPDLLWVEPTYLHQGRRLSAVEAVELGLKRKAPPQIRLEQIRAVTQFLSRPPLEFSRSIVVLEQAETMAEAAANGLLKTLEEPGRATLILIAPSIDALLPTLVSRCQRIPFYRLGPAAMAQVLLQKGQAEVLNHPEILAIAQGSPGTAIAGWHQLQEIPADLLQSLQPVPQSLRAALELARQIDRTLDTEAQRWLVDYLQQWYWQQQPGESLTLLHTLEKARHALRHYVQPRLVWEVTLMAMGTGYHQRS